MKLSTEAVNVLAECFSRSEHVTVDFNGVLETEVWCNVCMEFTQVRFAMKGISEKGVYDLGSVTACPGHEGAS